MELILKNNSSSKYIDNCKRHEGKYFMKKRLLKVILAVFLIFILEATTNIMDQYKSKSFEELLGIKETNITKVFMRNGWNGHAVETTDKEKIKELVSFYKDRTYRKEFKQVLGSGFIYFCDFYSGDMRILRISENGKNISFNSSDYNVSKKIFTGAIIYWGEAIYNGK